jgi:ParB family chromosome partitioning protein
MVRYVDTADCEPLIELERDYYDQANFLYLKKTIERDGFKKVYPVRAIFDRRRNRYQIFDGIHRLKVAQALGIKKMPLEDETALLTKEHAIAEGIKANRTHAYYNPMDLARNLGALGKTTSAARKGKSFGRPESVSLSALAELTGMSEKSISQYLQLLRLPEDVQTLVGMGRLPYSHALVLLRLDKTASRYMIPQLAQQVLREEMSRRDLEGKVESIRRKGYVDDNKICVGCKKVFPKDHLSYPCLCPSCVQKLRSGKLEPSSNPETDKRTEAMRNYLRLNALLEERWTKQGKEIPEKPKKYLEKLYDKWKNPTEAGLPSIE